MRIPREWRMVGGHLVVIACAGVIFATVVWLIRPFRDRLPAWLRPPVLLPQLEVAKPVVNIGPIPQMSTGRQMWVIENTGQAPLRFRLEDQSDCGLAPCTLDTIQVEDPGGAKSSTRDRHARILLPPGGRASVTMYWESRRTSGTANPHLVFSTNDPNAPRLRLTMIATILPAVPQGSGTDTSNAPDPSPISGDVVQ